MWAEVIGLITTWVSGSAPARWVAVANSGARGQQNWLAVEDDYRRFRENVAEKWGKAEGFVGHEFDQAAREFFDMDDLAELEEYVRANAPTSATESEEKENVEEYTLPHPVRTSQNRITVTMRIHEDIADQIRAFASANNCELWEVQTAIMREYNAGGRTQRLKDLIMESPVEMGEPTSGSRSASQEATDEADRDYEADSKLAWLTDNFTDEDGNVRPFSLDDFGEALDEMPFHGNNSEYMRTTWLPKVRDELGLTEHPLNPDISVKQERADEILEARGVHPAAPPCEYRDYDALSTEQRIHAIRIGLVRKAGDRGKSFFTPEQVQRRVFDGEPTEGKTKRLMNQAADGQGFQMARKNGKQHILCDVAAVTDQSVREDAGRDWDTTDGSEDVVATDENKRDKQSAGESDKRAAEKERFSSRRETPEPQSD